MSRDALGDLAHEPVRQRRRLGLVEVDELLQLGVGGVAGHDDVVGLGDDDVLGAPVEGQPQVGDDPSEGRRTRDELAVDLGGALAVVRLVGVAGHHDVDGVVEPVDDVDERAVQVVAVVVQAVLRTGVRRLRRPFVEQHDDRLDPLGPQLGDVAVGRLGLVEEVHPGDAGLRHDRGGALERHADEAHLDALDVLQQVGREDRLPGLAVDHVRSEEGEAGTLVVVAGLAAVGRMAAALLQPQQLVDALVELVVPDRRDVEPEQVECLDGGLVVEER